MRASSVGAMLVQQIPPSLLRKLAQWQFSSPFARRVIRLASSVIRRRDVTIRHGLGAGLKFNTGNANPGYALGTSEPLIQSLLQKIVAPGDVFYDIGANVGFFAILAAKLVGPHGRVYAFEPLPANAASLQHNVVLNGFTNVTVFETAISSADGEGELLLGSEPTQGRLAASVAPGDAPAETITIPISSLDQLIVRHDLKQPDLVKIDIEGAEVDAIAGMRRTLAECRPLVLCEMHGTNQRLASLFKDLGYWSVVVERPELDLADAHWNAHVLAGPCGKEDFQTLIRNGVAISTIGN